MTPRRTRARAAGSPGPGRLVQAALLALCATIVLALTAASPLAAQEDDATTGPPPAAPRLALVERPPWIAADDAVPFVVSTSGDLGDEPAIRVRIHRSLRSVDELTRSRSSDVGAVVFRSPPLPLADLAPAGADRAVVAVKTSTGEGDEFTATLDPGVHPLVLELLDGDGEVVDVVRTPLVRLGDQDRPLAATPMAFVVDLAAPPTMRPDGTRSIAPRDLERVVRAANLLVDHPDLPLTLAARPDTIDALVGLPSPEAETVLTAVAGRDAIDQPYLPVSVAALRDEQLIGVLPTLDALGHAVLTDRVVDDPLRALWDPSADLRVGDAGLLTDLDVTHVLLPASATDLAVDADAAVDAGPHPLGDRDDADHALAALVWDDELSSRLAAHVGNRPDHPHLLLAELLLRSAPAVDGASTIVRLDALAIEPLAGPLLELLARPDAPIEVVPVRELVEPPPGVTPPPDEDGGEDGDSSTAREPIAFRGDDPPDLAPVAGRVIAGLRAIETFRSLVGAESPRGAELLVQVATAVSTASTPEGRIAAVDAIDGALERAFAGIRLAGQIDLNLTSRNGTLPVTVENDNAFAVDVIVRVRSDRLAFPQGERIDVTVPPGTRRLDIPVEALATGSVPVFVELWTADDQRRLDDRALNVRSTAISGVGLALSLGALAVLATWWVRNWRRNRRAATADA